MGSHFDAGLLHKLTLTANAVRINADPPMFKDANGDLVSPQEKERALNALYKMERDIEADKQAAAKVEEERRRALEQEAAKRIELEAERLRIAADAQRIENERLLAQAEQQRVQIEAQRVTDAFVIEQRKLDLDEERVTNERNQQVIALLQVASQALPKEQLLDLFHDLTARMLPGPSGERRQLATSKPAEHADLTHPAPQLAQNPATKSET